VSDNIVEACIVVSSCTKMSDYKKLRAAQLRQLCHDRGINTRRLKKLDLVHALEEFDSDNNERTQDDRNNDVENSVVGDDEVQLSRNLHDQPHQNNEIEMIRLRIELRNKEIELLEAQQRARPSNSYVSTSDDAGNSSAFSVTLRDVKCLLPKMTDFGDVVDFLQSFERVLILQNVDKSLWHQLLPG